MLARYKDIIDVDGVSHLISVDDRLLVERKETLREKLASHFTTDYIYLFSSRRAALKVLLRALDIGGKDEVVIPALTDPLLADSVLSRRSVPHLADIDTERMAMKPSSLRRILARGRTRLVVDMPLGGPRYGANSASTANESGIPFVADISLYWPTRAEAVEIAASAVALVTSFTSGHPLVTGRGGMLAVRDTKTAKIIESLIADLPRVSKKDDYAAIKGLLIQNRLLTSDIYTGDAPADLGYLYARGLGGSLDISSLFDDDYIEVVAQEALAERRELAAEPKVNILHRFKRWIHPSAAVPDIETRLMGDLSAAVAELHFDRIKDDGERRSGIAQFYHAELVRLEQVNTIDLSDEPNGGLRSLNYPVLLGSSVSRSQVIRRCRRAGFEVGPFYYPRPLSGLFPYYKLCRHTAKYLRGAWKVASSLLNLPLHQEIDDLQAARLVRVLKG